MRDVFLFYSGLGKNFRGAHAGGAAIKKLNPHSSLTAKEGWFTAGFLQTQPVFSEAGLGIGESEIRLF